MTTTIIGPDDEAGHLLMDAVELKYKLVQQIEAQPEGDPLKQIQALNSSINNNEELAELDYKLVQAEAKMTKEEYTTWRMKKNVIVSSTNQSISTILQRKMMEGMGSMLGNMLQGLANSVGQK